MNKLDGKSMDIVSENVEKLKELFPEVFSEGKIDFKKFEEELGQFSDVENERYNFTWNGKQEAKRIAQTPSTGTLRPSKFYEDGREDSKNWDTTQNLYIEGDNLEVLKLLQKSYHKKVKMIYIDPPYNTGKDFVYKDNFKDNIKNYMEQTGQVDSEGNRLSTNSDTNGRYHSDWLSMMYPRLKLARNLLKDDGVIFISIDDNEVSNLRKVCDEIFGEDNFVGEFVWKSKLGKVGTTSTISATHEYILCYAKSFSNISFKMIEKQTEGRRENLRQWGQADRREDRPSMYFPIEINGVSVYPIKEDGSDGRWRVGKESAEDLLQNGLLDLVEKNGQYGIYRNFPDGVSTIPFDTLLLDEIGTTAKGSYTLKDLGLQRYFDYSKSTELVSFFLNLNTNTEDIVIDFFSGSATTAHSVMRLNSIDNHNRKFIMVQLPEETDENTEAYTAGYKNICEIGKERIRRAGDKIIADNPDKDLSKLDTGFKVYKLDSSNIKEWDSDFDNLEANLLDSIDNIKSDRTSEDILYEILLKYGLDLTLHVEEKTIAGKTVYNIGFGALVVCLDDEITIEVVEAIAEFIKEQVVYDEEKKKRHARVVFKDKSFADTNVKTNAIQVLKQFDIDEVVSI